MSLSAEQQFVQLVEANRGIVRKVARLYADTAEDRQDLEQEILYHAWRAFPGFRREAKFSTWLYRVSLNTALTFRKRADRRSETSLEQALHCADDAAPDPTDQAERLYAAIRLLGEAERALILLHLDGYSNPEIAQMVGITPNLVAVKLHRIKQSLTQRLNP
ncbi:MAG: sigma-70 family RNA polymerase sigma factor [Saprospiraceae bacterium]|nr:sigma-70 family RNA polymerase sigma factor [Saprospiraceae bacterium]MDW8484313.1 sigma-70 family RNA polymerase sigma factor [Saprospiraceae bacterium]